MKKQYKFSAQHVWFILLWLLSVNVFAQGQLTLTQPTYNCQTGAITFNTTGGDGSPITYSAPGVGRASVTDNYGTVEQELRNDPKPITITATQSGFTTSYTFDFGANCSSSQYAPTLIGQIPDQTRTVGVQIVSDIIPVSSYFRLPSAPRGFRPVVNYKAQGLPDGMLLFDASNEGQNLAYIGGTPTKVGVYTVTISAFVSNLPDKPTTTTTFKISIVDTPTPGRLFLTAPGYNCQTGAITFNTTGGDGSPITYSAPGITRTNVTDNFGTVEQGLRNDPKSITITATQSGFTTSYTFDFGAYCNDPSGVRPPVVFGIIPNRVLTVGKQISGFTINQYFVDPTQVLPYRVNLRFSADGVPPGLQLIDDSQEGLPNAYFSGAPTTTGVYTVTLTARSLNLSPPDNAVSATFTITVVDGTTSPGDVLRLLAPTYNCQTGAITFNTTGGDGSTIEYKAAGITDWTTNPNQFVDAESRTANDVQPFTLMARQSGQVVTYTWDLKAACGRNAARMASLQPESKLLINVLGNPLSDELRVRIEGSAGQPVGLQLIDASGRLIDGRRLESDQAGEEQRFDLSRQRPGLLILRAGAGTQKITTKIIKQ